MPDGCIAFQPLDYLAACEMIANKPEAALSVEMAAVEADDACGLLTSVLKRMQTERGKRGRVRMVKDAKDAAFLV
jgi:hypothetical protein